MGHEVKHHCNAVRRRARAFSLAELVVAIGVLAIMFALAGQVFSLTLRSTGQARALTGVNQTLRQFERTLREDLQYVQPGSSVMVIQSNYVRAYWTANGRQADPDYGDLDTQPGRGPDNGYPHPSDPDREDANGNLEWPRADMLMVFAARPGESFTEPTISAEAQAIVYGHAELGDYLPDGEGGYVWQGVGGSDPLFPVDSSTEYPEKVETSPVTRLPAEDWHLARRSVLLVPTPVPTGKSWGKLLNDAAILDGTTDIVCGNLSGIIAPPDGGFGYSQQVLTPMLGNTLGGSPYFLPQVLAVRGTRPNVPAFARSRLDRTPPALLGQRLGNFLLDHCASFKVEWALDPRSEFVDGRLDGQREVFWFDMARADLAGAGQTVPGPAKDLDLAIVDELELYPDGDGPLNVLLNAQIVHADGMSAYSLADRLAWPSDPDSPAIVPGARANLVTFTAQRRNIDSDDLVAEDVFPRSLRITVDVYDEDHRLERPVRHVFEVPVGG